MAGHLPLGSDPASPPADPLEEAVRLHDLACAAREAGRHEEAERLAAKSFAIFESETGPDHPDVANVLLCLAAPRLRYPRRGQGTD